MSPDRTVTCAVCDGAGVIDTSPPAVARAPWLATDAPCSACDGTGEVAGTAASVAMNVLRAVADPETQDRAEHLAETTHAWVLDPEVDGVIGLVRRGTIRAALLVMPADLDFEEAEEFWSAPPSSETPGSDPWGNA